MTWIVMVGSLVAPTILLAQTPPTWPSAGGTIANSNAFLSSAANASSPTQLAQRNISRLTQKWAAPTLGDISATPTVEPGGVYVTDWAGMLYKFDPATGTPIWSQQVCSYTSTCGTADTSVSRTSPAIGTNVIVIGDAIAHPTRPNYGAVVMAVNKATGALAWSSVVNNSSPYASVIGGPVIYNNVVYVGTASWEEGRTVAIPGYQPVFRGNVVALNVNTGAIIWKFTTVPSGYTGGAVWGSGMAIWPAQNALIFSTGNNYSVPAGIVPCLTAAGTSPSAQSACLAPTNYVDSLVSLNLSTGRLNWGRQMQGADTWVSACPAGLPGCPVPTGRDADFAQGPILTWMPNFTNKIDDLGGVSQSYMIGAGQKNSLFYAVNPVNGGLFWYSLIGTGGMQWGSTVNSADQSMFYVALNNPGRVSQTIVGRGGTHPQTWNAGAWAGLNTLTGGIKWMVPTIGADLKTPSQNAAAPGCITYANRLLFAGSTSGILVALDANNGSVYWQFSTGATVVSCPAVYNETLYWGVGYARSGIATAQHFLYAFAVPNP